jgi:hypothetical protein
MTFSLCFSFLLAKAFSASFTVFKKVSLICESTSSCTDAKALFFAPLAEAALTGAFGAELAELEEFFFFGLPEILRGAAPVSLREAAPSFLRVLSAPLDAAFPDVLWEERLELPDFPEFAELPDFPELVELSDAFRDADGSRTALPYFAPSEVSETDMVRFLVFTIYTSCSVFGNAVTAVVSRKLYCIFARSDKERNSH